MDYLAGLGIDGNARIAKSATVIGDVSIGADCTVFPGTCIRGDYGNVIEIGEGTNLQENCVVHVNHNKPTRIGKHVTVGHGAIVHGCTIGDETLIGMGAIVIDNARIGSHCLVAAGALVTGTADIPDGMLVLGSPARAVRPLTQAEIEDVVASAAEYRKIGEDLCSQGLLLTGAAYRRALEQDMAQAREANGQA